MHAIMVWHLQHTQRHAHLVGLSSDNLNQFVCFVVLDGKLLLLSSQFRLEIVDLRRCAFQLLQTVLQTINVGLQFFVFALQ